MQAARPARQIAVRYGLGGSSGAVPNLFRSLRGKKVKPKHPETGAVVEIVRQASEISSPKVIFDRPDVFFTHPPVSVDRKRAPTVVEIQLPTKTLRIQ